MVTSRSDGASLLRTASWMHELLCKLGHDQGRGRSDRGSSDASDSDSDGPLSEYGERNAEAEESA